MFDITKLKKAVVRISMKSFLAWWSGWHSVCCVVGYVLGKLVARSQGLRLRVAASTAWLVS